MNHTVSYWRLVIRAISLVVLLFIIVGAADAATYWNAYPGFDLADRNVSSSSLGCYANNPWAPTSTWGVEASTFTSKDKKLDAYQLQVYADRGANGNKRGKLWGKENRGYWGFVRFIQGNAWGTNTSCGNKVNWRVPTALSLNNAGKLRQVSASVDVYRTGHGFNSASDGWVMYGYNIWFTHPDLPGQTNGKRVVMDIVTDLFTKNRARLRNYKDANEVFHFQKKVGTGTPLNAWKTVPIDVDALIDQALDAVYVDDEDGGTIDLRDLSEEGHHLPV